MNHFCLYCMNFFSSDNEVLALEYWFGCVKAKYPLYICMQMEALGNNGTNSFHIQILREAIFVATQARMQVLSTVRIISALK